MSRQGYAISCKLRPLPPARPAYASGDEVTSRDDGLPGALREHSPAPGRTLVQRFYSVAPGDTWDDIAEKARTTVSAIFRLNPEQLATNPGVGAIIRLTPGR